MAGLSLLSLMRTICEGENEDLNLSTIFINVVEIKIIFKILICFICIKISNLRILKNKSIYCYLILL